MFTANVSGKSKSAILKTAVALLAVLFLVIPATGLLSIDLSQASGGGDDHHDNHWKGTKFCSRTAMAAFSAGQNEVRDDYWIAVGNCNNLSEAEDRAECLEDAKVEYKEGKELTKDQREARLEICENLGEAPYDPELDPEDFVDPATAPNQYFPLVPGTIWVYKAYDKGGMLFERITVTVKDEIKTIEYPEGSGKEFPCVVVNDVVEEFVGEPGQEGDETKYFVKEDTFDWYIQYEGTRDVLYMGEISRDFELDLDGKPELVEIEGSWKAGRDFAKPGIVMWGDPDPKNEDHDLYRQEFALGNAEDMGEVISRDALSVTIELKGGVKTFDDDVVQTKDWTPIEPEVFELKYYAPGIGMIKEENPETGEYVVLFEKTTVAP